MYRYKMPIRSLVFLITCLLCITSSFAGPQNVVLYDLTYTTKVNFNNPNETNLAWDHCHTVSALQGIVNRQGPKLYLIYVDSQHAEMNIDRYWLDKYKEDGKWLADTEFIEVKSLKELIQKFRDEINGLVVYDPNLPATSNVASAVAGAESLLPIRYDTSPGSLYSLLTDELKLKVKVQLIKSDGSSLFTGSGKIPGTDRYTTGSAKCDAYIWMKELYLDTGKLNPRYGAYYIDYYWATNPAIMPVNHHNLTNHDFCINKKAWFFDLHVWADEAPQDDPTQRPGTDRQTLKELLLSAYNGVDGKEMIHIAGFPPWAHKYTKFAGGRHPDVSTEWEYCKIISAYNAFKDADALGYGAMANSSFWQYFPLKSKYPQDWVTKKQLKEKGFLNKEGKLDLKDKELVIFYVGDYDSSAWLYQRILDLWDDPARGKVPLMWAISPVISVRAPMAMDYIRKTATENDYFVSADNGAGYLNPGVLQYSKYHTLERPISGLPSGVKVWQEHCKKHYDQWGLTVTGFIIDGFAQRMDKGLLDCYETFSPNGVVWQKGAISYLHKNMPVLRSDHDINHNCPADAAKRIIQRVNGRPIPFHWFRNILKSPTWYNQLVTELNKLNPNIELVDAPTFFELYRIYLKENPDAANGKYDYFKSLW